VLPGPIARLLDGAGRDRALIERRLRIIGGGITGASAEVLGKNYRKQVDVVVSDWSTGPEILISTKRMDSSFGKNAANRVEESYGDAKNLRLRYPQAALGFVYGLNSMILTQEPLKADWLIDLLGKLGREDDAYHAVCLVLMDFSQQPPPDSSDGGDGDEAAPTADVVDDVDEDEVAAALDSLPEVAILRDRVPVALRPETFLATILNRVLDNTPIDYHREARRLRDAAAE
jgi:hypothetical protein